MVDKITNPPSQKGVIDKINEIITAIPTVNNATLTITQGGTTKGTFTANASSDITIALDAGGGSDINLVGVAPITVTETQAGGAVNIDTSNGYIKGTYNNISSSYTVASYTATLQNSSISTSPSTVKEFFTGSVSYFDVPTDFGQRASNASGSLVSDVVRLSGYSSLNSNYNPMILWGYLDAQGEFTPVIYCKAYGAGEVVGYVNSVSNASTNTLDLVMAAAETSTTSTSSSQATGYDFTISLKTNGNMSARYDRYTGSTDYYNSRDLIPTATPSIYTNFLKINVARVFLRGNSTNSYLPTVNDTKLIKDGVTTSWKVTDSSVAGTSIGIDLSNIQEKLVSGTNIKTINSTSLLGSGDISVLQNTATGTNSLTIGGNATNYATAINIGYNSSAFSEGVAIGTYARTTYTGCTAIGKNTLAGGIGSRTTALGYGAEAINANDCIQIGYGTNSTSRSLNIGFFNTETSHYNYQLLDGTTGLIPDARLSSNIARTSDIPSAVTESTVSGWGFTKNEGTVTSVNNISPVSGNVTIPTTTVYPVIETYINGTSWYRIYAPDTTGYRWCEMGDLYYKGSTLAATDNTINFVKTFKDLNYNFTPTPLHSSANLNQYQMYEKYPERTTSSVVLRTTAAIFGYAWTACGYIANEV